MSFLRSMKAGRGFGAIVLAAAVGGAFACHSDRGDVVFQVGDFVFDFLVDQQLAGGYPAGTHAIDDFSVVFDAAVPDGFERATDDFPGFTSDGDRWIFGVPAHQGLDGRAPTITATDPITSSSSGLFIGTPAYTNANLVAGEGLYYFIISGVLQNLPPNTQYTVALVRYGVQVNAELDQAAILLGQPITQKDSLILLDPNPLGDPNTDINTATTGNTGDTIFAQVGANPYIFGNASSDGTGVSDIGIMVSAWTSGGTGVFFAGLDAPPTAAQRDSALFGRNDAVSYGLPRYNYVVLFEGVGVTGPTLARWQVGQDLDLNGNPLNNGFYPYPTTALTKSAQLALPCCAGQASDLTFTFDNLEELPGAVYQVWLWNEETNDLISPSGDWEAADSEGAVVNSGQGVNVFPSQADWTITFTTSDALAGQSVGPYTHVFLSVESSSASTPSTTQPLWSQYTDMAGAPADPFQWSFVSTGDMPFGTFGSGNPVEFTGPGIGEGGYWGQEVGTSDLLVVNYRNLQLPPVGYFYEAWLMHENGTPYNAGALMTTFDEGHGSLVDLDIDPSLSEFISTDGLILRSETRTQLACPAPVGGCVDSTEFYEFLEYRLTLTPKLGTGMPVTTVVGALTPEPVRRRKP